MAGRPCGASAYLAGTPDAATLVFCAADELPRHGDDTERGRVIRTYADVGGVRRTHSPDRSPFEDGVSVRGIVKVVALTRVTPEDMGSWFLGFESLRSADLSAFDTSRTTSLARLFDGCSKLQQVKGIKSLDVSSCRSLRRAFCGCRMLTGLDLSGWDMGRVETAERMFEGCASLSDLALPSTGPGPATRTKAMFAGCPADCSGMAA